MIRDPSILVAARSVADADLVAYLLRDEFANVKTSTTPEYAIADFEKRMPCILVLSFDTLEGAQRYYLGLYRLSKVIHTVPHRTIVLCDKNELWLAYELCKKQQFDDYVLFWPITNDAPRLRMAVHHAVQLLEPPGTGSVTLGQFAAQAHRMSSLEPTLAEFTRQFTQAIDETSAIARTGATIHGRPLSAEELRWRMRNVETFLADLRRGVAALPGAIASQLQAAQTMRHLAEAVRPVVLAVDDDAFEQTRLTGLLAGTKVDLLCAGSGAEALGMLFKHRPDLVLMDVELPDLNGVELMRRLKSAPQFAHIPVIMLTGHREKSVVMESLAGGASDFLVKPYVRARLLEKLNAFIPGSVERAGQPGGPGTLHPNDPGAVPPSARSGWST
ncbi:response regulator [Trinickia diaoshuihuensis]|uniref:response regulator n=1 Tax=Trinickia diaoshuihuensis TaxID=2292265 RepID=UPI000E23FBDC|nr:response regulator [Trinickia diaoshuihuensis]